MPTAKFIVLRRSTDETTFALVSAKVSDKKLLEEGPFLKALRKGITKWVRGTAEGKKAWNESCQDFNVGDLCQYEKSEALLKCLAVVGIFTLDISCNCFDYAAQWSYDTVLAEEATK